MTAQLDIHRLENAHQTGGKTIARCPACAETGGDKSGEHLVVLPTGKFGCIAYPAADGEQHRRRIFELAGTVTPDAPARPASRPPTRPARSFTSAEEAAARCAPADHQLVAVYPYKPAGNPFAAVARYEGPAGKTFRQFHATPAGWTPGAPAGKWPLFRQDEIPPTGPVYVCEGEKAALAAVEIGLPATTSAGGSKAASKTDWQPLAGRDVAVIPDNDDPGTAYAAQVAEILLGLTPPARVKIVPLPDLPAAGDIVQYIEARPGQPAEAIRCEVKELAQDAPEHKHAPAAGMDTPAEPNTKLDPIQAAKIGTPYAMTDLGNAERLAFLHRDSIRWDIARKCWRTWDGKRWAIDSALKINAMAADTVRKIRQEAAAAPKGEHKRDPGLELFSWAIKSESRDRLAAMIEVAKAQPGIAVAADELDGDPWILNVNNGTIDLRTGELRPHNRADMLTKLAPVDFRPGLTCKRWQKFLEDSTQGDTAVIDFLQVITGYTLTGDTTEEKLFLIYGPEASGKSTFLDAIRAMLGDYARTIQADLLTRQKESRGGGAASPELAGLVGARLAAGSEIEQGREIAEALAKNLTGGEPITARHLYAELFDFRPQFKLWLALNHCPKVSADDGAIWRRILRIGFDHAIPPELRDKTLKPYLRNHTGGGPAVLAWAVAGCLRWRKEGLTVPEAVERETAAYRQESDPLAAFFEDCLIFNPLAWSPWGDIWEAYTVHAQEQGTGERYRVAPKRLQERLKARGCISERRRVGRGWAGVELLDGWKSGERDGCDACDTNSKSFPTKKLIEKVCGKPSQASQASHTQYLEVEL